MPKRSLIGTVTSDKMTKTLVVTSDRKYRERRTGKTVAARSKFKVHCEEGGVKTGDLIEIIECRPYSKEKKFRFLKIIKKAAEVGQLKEDA
jgi:small subunit ribosomal protein S17